MIRWLIAAAASIAILIALLVAMSMVARFFFPAEEWPDVPSSVTGTNSQKRETLNQPASELPSPDECVAREEQINIDITTAGYCSSDIDCTFESFGCPFGCIDAVNLSNVELVRTKAQNYRTECSPCEYRCAAPGLQQIPKCVNNQCIVFEKTIDMLQDETRERIRRSR